MEEIWKKVPGFPMYEVSTFGRVRSYFGPNCKTVGKTPRILGDCIQHGYPRFSARTPEGKLKVFKVHIKVLETFIGPRPDGADACHLDGSRNNNRLDNLVWASRKENMRHRDLHGRTPKGVLQHFAKLCEDDVREIRALAADGYASHRELGKMFGLHGSAIKAVIDRRTWKHID